MQNFKIKHKDRLHNILVICSGIILRRTFNPFLYQVPYIPLPTALYVCKLVSSKVAAFHSPFLHLLSSSHRASVTIVLLTWESWSCLLQEPGWWIISCLNSYNITDVWNISDRRESSNQVKKVGSDLSKSEDVPGDVRLWRWRRWSEGGSLCELQGNVRVWAWSEET